MLVGAGRRPTCKDRQEQLGEWIVGMKGMQDAQIERMPGSRKYRGRQAGRKARQHTACQAKVGDKGR
jgi:hypothetical protein